MDALGKLAMFFFGLCAAYFILVNIIIPLVVFAILIALVAVLPTYLLGLILQRETPQNGVLNSNPAVIVAAMIGAGIFAWVEVGNTTSSGLTGMTFSNTLTGAYAVAVYATAGLYVLYLTWDFVIRTRHYYHLPNLSRAHLDSRGRLDPSKVIRDAPNLVSVQKQTAWISHNQALRAAQALSALTGSGSAADFRPAFLDEKKSKLGAARELVQAYSAYVRRFKDEYLIQHEEEHYQSLKRQRTNA